MTDVSNFLPPAIFSRAARLALEVTGRMRPALNLVISNVPGPPVPLYCAGARMLAHYPVSVVTDGVGLNITVMSYEDRHRLRHRRRPRHGRRRVDVDGRDARPARHAQGRGARAAGLRLAAGAEQPRQARGPDRPDAGHGAQLVLARGEHRGERAEVREQPRARRRRRSRAGSAGRPPRSGGRPASAGARAAGPPPRSAACPPGGAGGPATPRCPRGRRCAARRRPTAARGRARRATPPRRCGGLVLDDEHDAGVGGGEPVRPGRTAAGP